MMNSVLGALLDEYPRTQLAQSDPKKWDAEWEALFTKKPFLCDVNQLFYAESLLLNPLFGMDDLYQSYQNLRISTCTIQLRIGHLDVLHGEELAEKWTAASVADREHHALKALSSVCSMAKNLNDARAYCSRELRLGRMAKDPKVMLDLLQSIVPGGAYIDKPPETPFDISNDEWDALAKEQEVKASETGKITYATMLMLRTKLIYLVVECTFHSLIGKAFPAIVLEVKSSSTERDDKKAPEERAHQRLKICLACGATETLDGMRFKECSVCRSKMDRRVTTYCSPVCQKAHWKIHKPTCGKTMPLESIMADTWRMMIECSRNRDSAAASLSPLLPESEFFNIGPPIGGFKRSRALALHIRRLAESKTNQADFFLRCGPTLDDEISVSFPSTPTEIRELCLAARNAAMTRGDRPTVAVFCHFVLWRMIRDSVPPPKIDYAVGTMSQEFAYPLSALKADILEQQAKQTADIFARPPLLGNVSARTWNIFVDDALINRSVKVVFC